MQFSNFSDFINMGGYAFYVWLSFGAAALLLSLLTISSKAGHEKTMIHISKRLKREDKLRQSRKQKQQETAKQTSDLNEVTQ
jgi:heme exporter protein D